MNRVELTGKIASEPTISESNSGAKYVRFMLSCPRNFRGADGKKTSDYIPCTCWGTQAEYAEKWAKKGEYALVSGWLGTWRRHTAKGDYAWCVNVQTIEIMRSTNEMLQPDPEDAKVMELIYSGGYEIPAWTDLVTGE